MSYALLRTAPGAVPRVRHSLSRVLRQIWHVGERAVPFLLAIFSQKGLPSRNGRVLIRGKFRRIFLTSIPPLARYLQRYHGLQGGCQSCGASCNLLNRCPHWDPHSRLCTVYELRPNTCRLFPITPADLRDRDLALAGQSCGFQFAQVWEPTPLKITPQGEQASE